MNYNRIHDSIIENARLRALDDFVYKERHHVIPKCMKGTNDKSNLVVLTGREHFLIHILLTKIFPENKKLLSSVMRMTHKLGKQNSRLYEEAKKRWSVEVAKSNSGENNMWYGTNGPMGGRKHTDQTKSKMKISHKRGKDHPFYGAKGSAHPAYGKNNTPEAVAKRSGKNAFWYGKISATRGTVWFTNGKENLRLPRTKTPPDGWKNGRTFFKHHRHTVGHRATKEGEVAMSARLKAAQGKLKEVKKVQAAAAKEMAKAEKAKAKADAAVEKAEANVAKHSAK